MRDLVLLMCVASALTACAKSRVSDQSSETHFLMPCTSDCGAGLSCLCGVCTQACASSTSCEALGERASCEAPVQASCAAEMICDQTCERDSECEALGDRFDCSAGRCREPREGGHDDEPSDSGVPSDAMTSEPQDAEVIVDAAFTSCEVQDVIASLVGDGRAMDCNPTADDAPGDAGDAGDADIWRESLDCVRTALETHQPFHYLERKQGIDSVLIQGFFGVHGPDGQLKVSRVSYDIFGEFLTQWTPLAWFQVEPGCTEAPEECFVWSTEGGPSCHCDADSSAATCAFPPGAAQCPDAVGTPEAIGQSPRANHCAELFALSMGNDLTADAASYERIDRDLQQIEAMEPLTAGRCPHSEGFGSLIFLTADFPTAQAIEAGTYEAWNCLNEHYGLLSHSVRGDQVTMSLKGTYRLPLLLEGYRSLPGVLDASINFVAGFAGTPTTPKVEQSGSTLTYTIVVGQECNVNGNEGCTAGTTLVFSSQADGRVAQRDPAEL